MRYSIVLRLLLQFMQLSEMQPTPTLSPALEDLKIIGIQKKNRRNGKLFGFKMIDIHRKGKGIHRKGKGIQRKGKGIHRK